MTPVPTSVSVEIRSQTARWLSTKALSSRTRIYAPELLDHRSVTDDERSVTLGMQNTFTPCVRFAISCRNHLHIQPKVGIFRWSIQCLSVALFVSLRRINSCANPLAMRSPAHAPVVVGASPPLAALPSKPESSTILLAETFQAKNATASAGIYRKKKKFAINETARLLPAYFVFNVLNFFPQLQTGHPCPPLLNL
jgi:hypothetical protein